MAVDKQKLESAFALLRGHNQLEPFVKWLLDEQDQEMKQLVAANDDVVLRQAQGAVRKLQKILGAIRGPERG